MGKNLFGDDLTYDLYGTSKAKNKREPVSKSQKNETPRPKGRGIR